MIIQTKTIKGITSHLPPQLKKEAEYMAKEYSHNKQRGAKTYNDLTLQEAYRRYIDSKSSVLPLQQ